MIIATTTTNIVQRQGPCEKSSKFPITMLQGWAHSHSIVRHHAVKKMHAVSFANLTSSRLNFKFFPPYEKSTVFSYKLTRFFNTRFEL